MVGAILLRILQRSQPTTAEGVWGFLPPVSGMRNLAITEATLSELSDEFTPELLEAERIMIRRSDNQLRLNPVLLGDSICGLFLRSSKDGTPFDVVNQSGSLATDDPPALSCGRDFFTKRFSGDTNSVLVTFSDDDLAISRMLSLPCTPAAGLAKLNGEQLHRLFQGAPGYPGGALHQGQAKAVAPLNYRLLLAGWRVAELKNELPDGVASVAERFVKAEDAFGFDTSQRVGIWQPTPREFSRICSAAEFQDRALVRKLIWRSVCHSTRSTRQFLDKAASRHATDYDAARRELLRTISRAQELGFQSSEVAKRLEDFNRAFDKGVVDSIIRDALSATDSVDRALLLTAAELMANWHKTSSLVRSTQDGISGHYHPRDEALHLEELKERLRVVDGLVKIHRELTRNK